MRDGRQGGGLPIRTWDEAEGGLAARPVDAAAARQLLAAYRYDVFHLIALRGLLARLHPGEDIARLGDDDVLERAAAELLDGGLRLGPRDAAGETPHEYIRGAPLPVEEEVPARAAPAAAAAPAPKQATRWAYRLHLDWDRDDPEAGDDEVVLVGVDEGGEEVYRSAQNLVGAARPIADDRYEIVFHDVLPGHYYTCYLDLKEQAEDEAAAEDEPEDSWDDVEGFTPYDAEEEAAADEDEDEPADDFSDTESEAAPGTFVLMLARHLNEQLLERDTAPAGG